MFTLPFLVQLLKLWCGSSCLNLLLAELCIKLEAFVLRWVLFLVAPAVCCSPGAASAFH